MQYPERDPVLSSAEKRLYAVDMAVEMLAKSVPQPEIVQAEIVPARTVPRVVNLEERRQQAGVNAQEQQLQDAHDVIAEIYGDQAA